MPRDWTDVPADPSPRELPDRSVDLAKQRDRARGTAEQATQLRQAVEQRLAVSAVTVIALHGNEGRVRIRHANGSSNEESWLRDETGWRPRPEG